MESIKLLFKNGEWNNSKFLILEGNITDIRISPISMFNAEIPSEEDWNEFIETLKDLRIEKWKEYYEDPDILDGHQWTFEIETEDLRVKTGGSNGYPGKDPGQTVLNYKGSLFEELEIAINKLAGAN